MKNTKWYFSVVHRALAGGPHYNAVKIVNGSAVECELPPTRSEVMGRKRVDDLNKKERGILVSPEVVG